ncbi:MAG: DUF349 domain-containing protein [Phycisphaerales bacterium]|nr:DUF349 domain-containing protein [Phycisphaerales bacterium]
MDSINQTPTTSNDQLKQWWTSKTFEGKEFCSMDDTGALKIAPFQEKILTTLNHVTGDAVIQSLLDKFKDLQKQVNELTSEWASTDDKIKLMPKVNRLNEYVKQVNAIGDFESLITPLKDFDTQMASIVEDNYKAKLALVAESEAIIVEHNNWKAITLQFKTISEQLKTIGFVDRKRNELLLERFDTVKSKFFEEKRTHQEDIGKEMLQNLDLKMELVEKAEALASSENWKETSEVFKQLLEDWKKIGRTMPEKNESLWQQFNAAKNIFFDRKKSHTDQIRVEQEANYEKKKQLVEQAETIKDNTEWSITTQKFNELMTEWKTIGPLPSEYNTDLWDRFAAAKEVFFNAKRSQADAFKSMLDENYSKKNALIERAESLKNSSSWREATEEMNQLFAQWKQIGQVGREHSEVLWEKFISARKHFFNRKDQDRDRRKQLYIKNKELHYIQTKNFLTTLENESADEEAQIEEFKHSLENITAGPKSEELRKHLSSLIIEIEQRIKNRAKKIQDLRSQIQQLEQEPDKPST